MLEQKAVRQYFPRLHEVAEILKSDCHLVPSQNPMNLIVMNRAIRNWASKKLSYWPGSQYLVLNTPRQTHRLIILNSSEQLWTGLVAPSAFLQRVSAWRHRSSEALAMKNCCLASRGFGLGPHAATRQIAPSVVVDRHNPLASSQVYY